MTTPGVPKASAFRGEIVDFVDDPMRVGERALRHFADGVLVVRDGLVDAVGAASDILPALPADAAVVDYRSMLIVPGFVDCHVHYPQVDVIASYGAQLLDWLERYTYPAEMRFADSAHAQRTAEFFVQELLKSGTTTALIFATSHASSVDAIMAAARERSMRVIAGKVLMDRNAPDALRDTADSGYEESDTLIERWHGRDRLAYAVTPRFAVTSSERQLELCGRLLDEHPGVYLHSHLAENRGEVALVARLFPQCRSYLDAYDRYGLVRERSVYAHCIHLDAEDRRRMADSGAAIAFCASSNLFLGSGLFDLDAADRAGVRVGLGTDVGAGTSLSMLETLEASYKVCQLGGQALSPLRALYLATLGGARALRLDDRIGSFASGREADFVVLDARATPISERRVCQAESLADLLFALMILGDDRSVHATHVLGVARYLRTAATAR